MNIEQYFIDSSFVISLMDESDIHHTMAAEILIKIRESGGEIYLSDLVLNEVLSVFGRKCSSNKNKETLLRLLDTLKKWVKDMPILCLYELLNQSYGRVQDMIEKSNGTLSFHDCLIILFLKEVPLVQLVTFDQDFKLVKGLRVLSG